jgi:hypothetical protein
MEVQYYSFGIALQLVARDPGQPANRRMSETVLWWPWWEMLQLRDEGPAISLGRFFRENIWLGR